MRIVVLGAGVVGVTAAHLLAARGHQVAVLDRGETGGTETSFANGGQLSYSHAEPWANPHVLKVLPGWLVRSDAPLVFRPRADMDMIKWGLKFLRNCTTSRAELHCMALLRLGLYSRQKMQELLPKFGAQCDHTNKGILHVFSSEASLEEAIHQVEFQAKFGGEEKILSAKECYDLEPALAHGERKVAGGIHAFLDESADPYLFTNALIEDARNNLGVDFHFGTQIEALHARDGLITHVSTDKGDMEADIFIMAMGSYSPLFLKPLGINVPIYPMKGYSITIPTNEFTPSVSLTDVSVKLVYSKLGGRMRVAGTAEFAGYDSGLNEKRIAPIIREAKKLFPKAPWDAPIERWACLRPSTPDGPPILGMTPYPNLMLNTGHGTLGWTQAAGSAHIVADIIDGQQPDIMMHGLTLERYL